MIRVVTLNNATVRKLGRIQRAISSGLGEIPVKQTAWETHAVVVADTPKGWTGQTRKTWRVRRQSTNNYTVEAPGTDAAGDPNPLVFLEEGTDDHGPVTASALYIPLTAAASIVGWQEGQVFGEDFILVPWVSGIEPHWIVREGRKWARIRLRVRCRLFLTDVIRGRYG